MLYRTISYYHEIGALWIFQLNYNLPGRFCKKFGKLLKVLKLWSWRCWDIAWEYHWGVLHFDEWAKFRTLGKFYIRVNISSISCSSVAKIYQQNPDTWEDWFIAEIWENSNPIALEIARKESKRCALGLHSANDSIQPYRKLLEQATKYFLKNF